jgi:hypothetical protein
VGLVIPTVLLNMRVETFILDEFHTVLLHVAVFLFDHKMGQEGITFRSVIVEKVQTGLLLEAKWVRHTLYYKTK